jgi:alpha-galactosidase
MIEQVQKVMKDIKHVYPDYQEGQGVELAGFIWLQGWNDMVDNQTYPPTDKANPYDKYSEWLADLIRDVRKDLSAPTMPFVIGVMGVGGLRDTPSPFREAMAAPASLPEFKGNVVAIQMAPFWDAKLAEIEGKRGRVQQMKWMIDAKDKHGPNVDGTMTPEEKQAYMKEFTAKTYTPEDEALWKRGASNAGYHYLGCAKTFAQAGEAFADAVLQLQQ